MLQYRQLLLLVLLASSGCGGVDMFEPDAPPVLVTGRVFYRGAQLQNGWIVFSADPNYGAGTDTLMVPIGPDGTFQGYDSKQPGLKPGYYRIVVSTTFNNGTQLPRRYTDPNTSGLRCMVQANQPLRITIELD